MEMAEEYGTWHQHKGKLIEKFPALTDADLLYEKGKSEEMFSSVMLKIGKSKEEMAAIIQTCYCEVNN